MLTHFWLAHKFFVLGVIWAGGPQQVIFNNAHITVDKLKTLGKRVFLITNNSWRTQDEFNELCKSLNINIESVSRK